MRHGSTGYGIGPDATRRDRQLARQIIDTQAAVDRAAAERGEMVIVGGVILRVLPTSLPHPANGPAAATPDPAIATAQRLPWPAREPLPELVTDPPVNPGVNAAVGTLVNPAADVAVNSAAPAGGTVQQPEQSAARQRRTPARRPARKPGRKAPAPRKLRADYLAEARAAWSPDVQISPAWVRQVTACSRGMSSQVATALSAEVATHPAPIGADTSATSESEAVA